MWWSSCGTSRWNWGSLAIYWGKMKRKTNPTVKNPSTTSRHQPYFIEKGKKTIYKFSFYNWPIAINYFRSHRYTYGKNVKGKAKVEIFIQRHYGGIIYYDDESGESTGCGEDASYCRWNYELSQSECHPHPRCPTTTLDTEVSRCIPFNNHC